METASIPTSDMPPVDTRPSKLRSAVSNGRRAFVADGDGRTSWMRRWRDLCLAHLNDLGGEKHVSAAQVALVRRAATLEIELERQEAALSAGGRIDLDAFNRASGGLRRILESLGIERRPRDVTPTSDVLNHFSRRRKGSIHDEIPSKGPVKLVSAPYAGKFPRHGFLCKA